MKTNAERRLLVCLLTALALAGVPARAASCRSWAIGGFYLGMTEEEARAVIARDGREIGTTDGRLDFELLRNAPTSPFTGGLRFVDGRVASGYLSLQATGPEGAKGLAEELGRRFGEPRHESTKPIDTKTSVLALVWTDADCGMALYARRKTGNPPDPKERYPLQIELLPYSAYEKEQSAHSQVAADSRALDVPCTEPVELRLLDKEPVLVAGTRRQVQLTERFRKAGHPVRLVVQYLVLADGSVGEVRLVNGPAEDYGLFENTERMLKAQRFVPGTCRGKPVSTWLPFVADFSVR